MNSGVEGTNEIARQSEARRYGLLDFWRGLACLMVIIHHADEFAAVKYVEEGLPVTDFAGQCVFGLRTFGAGVTIFFVISGYCISAAVDGHGLRQRSVANYFSRRFWRIYPPYWAMFILMTLALSLLDFTSSRGLSSKALHHKQSPFMLTASQVFGNVTLTETWRYHLFGSEKKLFMTHAWTLCYEEQFYLIVGLTLLFFPKQYFQSIQRITYACLALIFLTWLEWIDISGFGFDRFWLPFALGALVYYRLSYASLPEKRKIDLCVVTLAILSTTANFLQWNWSEYSYLIVRSLGVSSVFAALLIAMYRWDSYLVTIPPFKHLASVGYFSYSLYLVHAPIVSVLARLLMRLGLKSDLMTLLITIPVCVAVSLPIAWGFFLLFERPFLHKKKSELVLQPAV